MKTCLLIDDEPASRVVLRELLNRFCTGIQVIGECGDVDSAEKLIYSLQPDLIFLDIQMPGKDGFELLRRFEAPSFAVIFITSYDHYAIKAIRFNALDYLLKPVDIDELTKAVDRFDKTARISAEVAANTFQFNQLEPKLVFHVRDKVVLVPLREIAFFEANSNYTQAWLQDGQHFIQAKPLSDIETMIADHEEFLRIHKSVIVNTLFIRSYTKGDSCVITMVSGHEFEISRRRKTELLQKLSSLQLRNEGM